MIKRADGSYSQRGLWDNIRANAGSGKKPTKEMLQQEKKIRAAEKKEYGGWLDEYQTGGARTAADNTYVQPPFVATSLPRAPYTGPVMREASYVSPAYRDQLEREYKSKQLKQNVVKPLLHGAEGLGNVMQLASFIPHPAAQAIGGLGDVIGTGLFAVETGMDLGEGNYKDAAISAGLTAAPTLIGKGMAKGIGKGMAKNITQGNPTLVERLNTASNTITNEGKKIIKDLSSSEGTRRLRNQFKDADNSLTDEQLDYLVFNRINEVKDALVYNQANFLLDKIKTAPNTSWVNTREYFPIHNAWWDPVNPYPNVSFGRASETLFPKVNRSSFNLNKQPITIKQKNAGYQAFADPNYEPGSISLGQFLENNKQVLDHEIGHAIQKGGEMPIDYKLRNLLSEENIFDRIFNGLISKESKKDKSYFTDAAGRNFKNESYPFAVEQRRKMIERGILNDRYDEITPWKLAQARLAALKNKEKNYIEGDRLIKFTPFWKYKQLSEIMNEAPALIPITGALGAGVAASQGDNQKYGGWLSNYKEGGRYVDGVYNPNADVVNKLAAITPQQMQMLQMQAKQNQSTIRPGSGKRGTLDKMGAIARNPVTALGYAARGQQLPDYFEKGARNPYDYAADVLNPMTYIDAGKRTATLEHLRNMKSLQDLPGAAFNTGMDVATIGAVPKLFRSTLNTIDREFNPIGKKLASIEAEGLDKGWSKHEIKKAQMEQVGITGTQRGAYTPMLSNFLDKYITPYGYNGYGDDSKLKQIWDNIKKGGVENNIKSEHILGDVAPERSDAWKLYLGKPQQHGTFRIAETVPVNHPAYNPKQLSNMDIYGLNYENELIPKSAGKNLHILEKEINKLENPIFVDRENGVMGGYNSRLSSKGLQYNDIWDLEPSVKIPFTESKNVKIPVHKFIGKPFMSHGNIPYTWAEHQTRIKSNLLNQIEQLKAEELASGFNHTPGIQKRQALLKRVSEVPEIKKHGGWLSKYK
jgi:hypothetical protein